MKAVKLFVSLGRISRFLACSEIDQSYLIHNNEDENSVQINSADLGWRENCVALKNINFKARKGEMEAGILLVQEAGGLVGDFMGGNDFRRSGSLIAGNPKMFKAVLKGLQASLTDDLK